MDPLKEVQASTCNQVTTKLVACSSSLDPKAERYRALDGLRGIAALWITLYHSFLFSKASNVRLAGSILIPFFFVLSGFSLGITEGKPRCSRGWSSTERRCDSINSLGFYSRRLVRIVPLFWITNALAAPLMWLGHSWTRPENSTLNFVTTVTGTGTWFVVPIVINGPSWFVSTLLFFYWCFPSVLPRLQAIRLAEAKRQWVKSFSKMQWFAGVFLEVGFSLTGNVILGFYAATTWPPSRFPVFLMGVLAGLLRLEVPIDTTRTLAEKKKERKNDDRISQEPKRMATPTTPEKWAGIADDTAVVCLVMLSMGAIGDSVMPSLGFGNFWLQLISPQFYVKLIWALTADNGLSMTSKVVNHPWAQLMGSISYSLYLVHESLISYIAYLYNGQAQWGVNPLFDPQWKHQPLPDDRMMPTRMIPVHLVVSVICAISLHYGFEEPLGKFLRPGRSYQRI